MSDAAHIKSLLAQVEVARQIEADQKQHLRLGELVDRLGKVDQSKTCVIEGSISGNPDGVYSYRGYYSDLAIDPSGQEDVPVSAIHAQLKQAIWNEFQGYKGGHYLMDRDTLVWVAEYGVSGGNGVVNVVEEAHAVVIVTAQVEDWS